MEIRNSTLADIDTLFAMYDAAIAHQKTVSHLHWLPFERSLVEREIAEQRQWKILVDGEIACVFLTAYTDPDIWGEKDRDPAVYLHRIATNPRFRGHGFVAAIVDWAKTHGKERGIQLIRLDTWADNPRLKEIYTGCGFRFLGNAPPANPAGLPDHYAGITLGFYEMKVG